MNIIRATLDTFASLVGVGPSNADDALRSERSAKAVLSRRNLFAAAGAMAAGTAFGFPDPSAAVRTFRHVSFVIKGQLYGEADGIQVSDPGNGRAWVWADPVTGARGEITFTEVA